jgi:transposase
MGLFPPAPGGGQEVNHGYKGKGVVVHLLADGSGKPLAITTTPANGNERLQVKIVLNKAPVHPEKSMPILQADKGYDSYWLRSELLKMNIFPFIPYRNNNKNAELFRRQFSIESKRWKIERTFSWLKRKCRRLLMRWERKISIWNAFTTLGLTFMWMEYLLR